MDRPEREILAHISAPSGAGDDARHLAQAESHFTFEAVSRIKIFPADDDGDTLEDKNGRILGLGNGSREVRKEHGSGKVNDGAGLTSGEELENDGPSASSPRCRSYSDALGTDVLGSQGSDGSMSHSLTTPRPQQRLGSGQGLRTSQRRYLDLDHYRVHSALLSPAQAVFSTSDSLPDQSPAETDSLEFLPSVVEDSQPMSLQPVEREEEHEPGQDAGSSRGSSLDRPDIYKSRSIDIFLSPPKRQRLGNSNSQHQTTYTTQSFPNSVATTSFHESLDISLSQLASFRSSRQSVKSSKGSREDAGSSSPVPLPLEIHPLPPSASNSPFETHITPTLQMLSERLGLSRIFNPTQKSRDLRTVERGYWLFKVKIVKPESEEIQQKHHNDDSVWPLPLFIRFWSFLIDFIGKEGRAGWGVWCVREPQNLSQRETDELNSPRAEHVKIYTWGEVVPHVYLLLFLASERRIKGVCAQWRDAKDVVVIQMN